MSVSIRPALVVLLLSAAAVWLERIVADGPLLSWQQVVGAVLITAMLAMGAAALGELMSMRD